MLQNELVGNPEPNGQGLAARFFCLDRLQEVEIESGNTASIPSHRSGKIPGGCLSERGIEGKEV